MTDHAAKICERCQTPVGYDEPYRKTQHFTKDGIFYKITFEHGKCR